MGQTALSLYVTGDDAYERTVTLDEIQTMCDTIRLALEAASGGPIMAGGINSASDPPLCSSPR